MSIPSAKAAREIALAATNDSFTVLCCACRAPLWKIKVGEIYGTRISAEKVPFPGVPPYEEFWKSDGKTALRTDCPKCGRDYFKAVPVEEKGVLKGVVAKFALLEIS